MKFCSKKVVAVIPAFNESKTIAKVIADLQNHCDVVVVDDGSIDETYQLSLASGSHVIRHSINRGYDQALDTGLKWACDQDYMFAITFDADGQHSAAFLPSFVEKLELGADIVIGVRRYTQRWAEYIFALVSKTLWGIEDPLCGMKGYRLSLLRRKDFPKED